MKLFVSYHHSGNQTGSGLGEEAAAARITHYLRKQTPFEVFCLANGAKPNAWTTAAADALNTCDAIVFIAGGQLGPTQCREADIAYARQQASQLTAPSRELAVPQLLVVTVGDPISWPQDRWADEFRKVTPIVNPDGPLLVNGLVQEGGAQEIAHETCRRLEHGASWQFDFEIPDRYPFDYEKDIIREFRDNKGRLLVERQAEGCPKTWPTVPLRREFFKKPEVDSFYDNPVPPHLIGDHSDDRSDLLVHARNDGGLVLTFNEARPRKRLRLPDPDTIADRGNSLRVGIIVSRGIAPGINSVIAGIVERHRLYQDASAVSTSVRGPCGGGCIGRSCEGQVRSGDRPLSRSFLSLHDFEENECILTTQRNCPCIEFHPTGEERYGFHTSQLLHYRLETEETTDHPPHKLTLGVGTADVILTGWRLDRVADHVRDGNLLAVRTCPIRYIDISRARSHAASIIVIPIAKG